MSGIYLGESGHVELERTSNNLPIYSKLDPEDVNVIRNRFSLDQGTNALITGDKIEIATIDKSDLELVAGHEFPDWTGFCHVDPVGGLYLYESYEQAIDGSQSSAIPLIEPSTAQDIQVRLARDRFRCIADITTYSVTTTRETVDVTSLGEEFRRNYTNGLISGQGQLTCLWSYKAAQCEDPSLTFPHYLSQLVIRTKLGGAFDGRFFLVSDKDVSIWYEALCIVTNVATTFSPAEPIISVIDFVTSGEIKLRMGMPESALLQESDDFILQEDDESRILLDS